MKAETPYIHLHERKRTWTPVQVSAGTLLDGGEEVVQRALALRCLEIPVGDFIAEAMKGDLPDVKGCKELLASNVTDEENHDICRAPAGALQISRLITQLKRIRSPINLREKLRTFVRRGLNLTGIRSSKRSSWNGPSSLSFSPSFDSSETQDYALHLLTSHVTSRPTSPLTPSSAKSLVLNLTSSSITLGGLRSLGCFNPSKRKEIISISRRTSGWRVLIRYTPPAKPQV